MVMPVEPTELPSADVALLIEAIKNLAVDSGIVSSPVSIGGNALNDNTKGWAANVHVNRLVKIIKGSGAGQLAVIQGNSSNSLVIRGTWPQAISAGAIYVILNADFMQMLRDVFGGGSDISAANPLETHDPEIADIEDKLDHPTYGLAALKALIDSLAGGAFYGSYGPKNVEVANDVDFGIVLYDPSGNIIAVGEITPGTYTVHRVRVAADTEIVAAVASSEAAGRVFMTYNFPVADWAVGDIFYVTFSGIIVTVDGVATEYPDLYIWGRVVREADISTKVDDIEAKLDSATFGLAVIKDFVDTLEISLGAFTGAENLKAILGDLATTKRLGQILGALDETNTLKAILGAYTAAAPLKAAIDTITGFVDLIDDVTNGLAAIKAEVEGLAGAAMRGTDSAALAATALTNVTWTGARAAFLDNLAPTTVGKLQIKATTVDLAQIGGTVVDLFIATTQDVVVEKLVIRMSGGTLVGSNLTSILIQTDDATPIVLIDIVVGAVANLTNEAQLAWTGAILLDAGTGAKIQVTLNGGAATAAKVCDVIAECRAVVAGGILT